MRRVQEELIEAYLRFCSCETFGNECKKLLEEI